jgi:hypothetical protein
MCRDSGWFPSWIRPGLAVLLDLDLTWERIGNLASAIEAAVVVVGVFIGVRQLTITARAERQEAHTVESQHMLEVMRKWDEPAMLEARAQFRSLTGEADALSRLQIAGDKEFYSVIGIAGFFEDLGFLALQHESISVASVEALLNPQCCTTGTLLNHSFREEGWSNPPHMNGLKPL